MPGATEPDVTLLSELALASALKGSERLARPASICVSPSTSRSVHWSSCRSPPGAGPRPPPSMGRPDPRRHRRANRARHWRCATGLTELADANGKLCVDEFGARLLVPQPAQGTAVRRAQARPHLRGRLRHHNANAPICKTVIDLAHSFGSVAVAVGIEKASDAVALVSMGCDYRPRLPARPANAGRTVDLCYVSAPLVVNLASGSGSPAPEARLRKLSLRLRKLRLRLRKLRSGNPAVRPSVGPGIAAVKGEIVGIGDRRPPAVLRLEDLDRECRGARHRRPRPPWCRTRA